MNRRQFLGRVSALAGGILLPYFPGFARASYLYLPHRRAAFAGFSWDKLEEPFNDFTSVITWTDNDNNGGESLAGVSAQGETVASFNSGASTGDQTRGSRNGDYGDAAVDSCTIALKLYHSALGTFTNGSTTDALDVGFGLVGCSLLIQFATNGMFIHDGAGYQEVGTDIVSVGVWEDWLFYVHNYSTPANADVDIYLGGALQFSDVDCSLTSGTSGTIFFTQAGFQNANKLTYVDYVKVGSGDGRP